MKPLSGAMAPSDAKEILQTSVLVAMEFLSLLQSMVSVPD
jgi:hypothetical protein